MGVERMDAMIGMLEVPIRDRQVDEELAQTATLPWVDKYMLV